MNLDFTVPAAGPTTLARSPMERQARAAGARFEERDGWNVAVAYGPGSGSAEAAVGWADVSHLAKLELQGPAEELERLAGDDLGRATRSDGAWWCRLTPTRALVVGERPALGELADGLSVVDVTTSFAGLTVVGPLARETIARFCALDLRPSVTPPGSLRPGSIARQPGILICEAEDRYLLLFGWATGEYMWSVVSDAGRHLGGRPIGVDALAPLPSGVAEVRARA